MERTHDSGGALPLTANQSFVDHGAVVREKRFVKPVANLPVSGVVSHGTRASLAKMRLFSIQPSHAIYSLQSASSAKYLSLKTEPAII